MTSHQQQEQLLAAFGQQVNPPQAHRVLWWTGYVLGAVIMTSLLCGLCVLAVGFAVRAIEWAF